MRKLNQLILRSVPYLFWVMLTAVTILFLIEVKPVPQTWPKDKLQHAIIFALLTYLGVKSYQKHVLYMCLGLTVYAGLMEVAQSMLTQARTGSYTDWLADIGGIALTVSTLNRFGKLTKVKV